jgi:hypothetical protein
MHYPNHYLCKILLFPGWPQLLQVDRWIRLFKQHSWLFISTSHWQSRSVILSNQWESC